MSKSAQKAAVVQGLCFALAGELVVGVLCVCCVERAQRRDVRDVPLRDKDAGTKLMAQPPVHCSGRRHSATCSTPCFRPSDPIDSTSTVSQGFSYLFLSFFSLLSDRQCTHTVFFGALHAKPDHKIFFSFLSFFARQNGATKSFSTPPSSRNPQTNWAPARCQARSVSISGTAA